METVETIQTDDPEKKSLSHLVKARDTSASKNKNTNKICAHQISKTEVEEGKWIKHHKLKLLMKMNIITEISCWAFGR